MRRNRRKARSSRLGIRNRPAVNPAAEATAIEIHGFCFVQARGSTPCSTSRPWFSIVLPMAARAYSACWARNCDSLSSGDVLRPLLDVVAVLDALLALAVLILA